MRDVVEASLPELLDAAIAEVGEDPFARVEEGTRFAQPALFCVSVARWSRAGRPEADFVAGHSLGELAALVAAGSLTAEDGLHLAARRGRLMQEAGEATPGGGMVALLGKSEAAREIAADHGLSVANDNAPGQLVLSGPVTSCEEAAAEATERGLKARQLPVAGAFHSAAMAPAVGEFERALDEVEVREPTLLAFSGVTAAPFDDVRTRLAEAILEPVLWRQTLLALHEAGAGRFVDVGPGKVLRGLVRRNLPDVEADMLAEPALAHA
jgi:acyl transferase domain-containing protein